ncbi:putative glycosyl transferase [Paratrimastix pyriformis]|uniref:GDP-Man:Man(3)GlcNAc(2)-PP-Dol alpha-1,2-mannosyltransferase n=1 Tax=Paratrimastix pyriformis TaxID=342808 RepID=A0ABQ8UI24_9EUKA|nr:putative glycosyl transferase [Paratrimastix pyriformis]
MTPAPIRLVLAAVASLLCAHALAIMTWWLIGSPITVCVGVLLATVRALRRWEFVLINVPVLLLAFFPHKRIVRWIATKKSHGRKIIAFFHPHCDRHAGGERVLWMMIHALAADPALKDDRFYIYTDSKKDSRQIEADARKYFGVDLGPALARTKFLPLRTCFLVEPHWYIRPTLVLQSACAMFPAFEALLRYPLPHHVIDTVGASFSYPVFRLMGGCRVSCYTHYPVISTPMIGRVRRGEVMYNNQGLVARNPVLSTVKLLYYRVFSWMYFLVGRSASLVMVNSSWTREQIECMWSLPHSAPALHTVFPPCAVAAAQARPIAPLGTRQPYILSIGQFRPEKNQLLQVRILGRVLATGRRTGAPWTERVRLILVGTLDPIKNPQEARLRDGLIEEAKRLGASEHMEVRLNVPTEELQELLRSSLVGLHTMRDEHFGIGVVEMMASGLITVAHRSAGPQYDIVKSMPRSDGSESPEAAGCLAITEEEYAAAIVSALDQAPSGALDDIQQRAVVSARRFDDKVRMTHSIHSVNYYIRQVFMERSSPLFMTRHVRFEVRAKIDHGR